MHDGWLLLVYWTGSGSDEGVGMGVPSPVMSRPVGVACLACASRQMNDVVVLYLGVQVPVHACSML